MPMRAERSLRLVHPASGRVIAESLERPRTFVGRGLGLMFRRSLAPGAGMWISPCSGIHMFFMRFAIDAIFLDSGDNVRKVYRRLRPWIGIVPLVWGAKGVVELPAGACDGLELRRGEPLRFE
jgi:uncharacterized membrane protein (UPF0127 family)